MKKQLNLDIYKIWACGGVKLMREWSVAGDCHMGQTQFGTVKHYSAIK